MLGEIAIGVFILVGVCQLVWPRWAWFYVEGCYIYDNPDEVELSGNTLTAIHVGGVLAIVFGMAMLIGMFR